MPLGSLWLAVVVSTVVVFVLSALMHAVLKYHAKEVAAVPDEDALSHAVAKQGLAPGAYLVPHGGDGSKCKDPAFKARWEKGPNFFLTVGPSGPMSMGKPLILWALTCFLVSFLTAYVARHALDFGAAQVDIARIVGTVSFMAYTMGSLTESIWKWRPWASTCLAFVDGAVYAAATAACFAFLWPAAA